MTNKPLQMLLFAILLLGFTACGARMATEGDIVNTTISPDPTISALTTRFGGNATAAWVDRVYLQSAGADARELLRADKAQDINVSWSGAETLVIAMKCGRVFSFQNFHDVLDKNGKLKKRITVMLNIGGLCPE